MDSRAQLPWSSFGWTNDEGENLENNNEVMYSRSNSDSYNSNDNDDLSSSKSGVSSSLNSEDNDSESTASSSPSKDVDRISFSERDKLDEPPSQVDLILQTNDSEDYNINMAHTTKPQQNVLFHGSIPSDERVIQANIMSSSTSFSDGDSHSSESFSSESSHSVSSDSYNQTDDANVAVRSGHQSVSILGSNDDKHLVPFARTKIQSEFDKALIEDTHSTGAFRSLNATPTIEQVLTVDHEDAVEMEIHHDHDNYGNDVGLIVESTMKNNNFISTSDSLHKKSSTAQDFLSMNNFEGLLGEQDRAQFVDSNNAAVDSTYRTPERTRSNAEPATNSSQISFANFNRDLLRRQLQQSVSAAVLVSLANKRYERRKLAAMEIEKVVRNLVLGRELDKVKGIILLLCEDYIRSTNEDARKGGAVSMAACAIGLKKAKEIKGVNISTVNECQDLILASVVHACQDNMQRVRYYATESLFNVIKVLPHLAAEHFFILFEILRSLWGDVDLDVRSGAEMLDKQLKVQIVTAINSGQFKADTCIPLFARFLTMKNKPTKRLTVMWLKEFSDKLVGAPLLEFLHLFLGDIFALLADPHPPLVKESLQFLISMLPQLMMKNEDFEDDGDSYNKINFDKILQNLVTTMEHPDPFVRKVAMYWVSCIIQAHIGTDNRRNSASIETDTLGAPKRMTSGQVLSNASLSVRNAIPHVLPAVFLCMGDTSVLNGKDENHIDDSTKDSFLPDETTYSLAEKTNRCLQKDVQMDPRSYIPYLVDFTTAIKDELLTPGGLGGKNRVAKAYEPYRKDLKLDGTGVESEGWYRTNDYIPKNSDNDSIRSRLCALDWIVLLFSHVVPDSLKDEYADEFIPPLIRLIDDSPEIIVLKSLEDLSKITGLKGAQFDLIPALSSKSSKNQLFQIPGKEQQDPYTCDEMQTHPMTDANATYALGVLSPEDKILFSRNREVFVAIIHSHFRNQSSMSSLSRIIRHMCALQPPEFVYVSFGLEIDHFVNQKIAHRKKVIVSEGIYSTEARHEDLNFAKCLAFTTNFAQILSYVLLTCDETKRLRSILKGCIANKVNSTRDERQAQLFHILLKTFAHDCVAAITLCLWSGAFRTASLYIQRIDPLDLDLMFYIELDRLIELIERPIFRDLHISLLEFEENPALEGSGAMLYRVLKSILMLLPQSTSYNILQQRLLAVARFRQCAVHLHGMSNIEVHGTSAEIYVQRILDTRKVHCDSKWSAIRSESLEPTSVADYDCINVDESRRAWLGYENEEDEIRSRKNFLTKHRNRQLSDFNDESRHEYVEINKDFENDAHQTSAHKDISDDQYPIETVNTSEGASVEGEIGDIDDETKDGPSADSMWKDEWARSD